LTPFVAGLAPARAVHYDRSVMCLGRSGVFGLIESAIAELLAVGPELFLFAGVPELPRRRRFITVRQGGKIRLETV
jgi:hypothetical protein